MEKDEDGSYKETLPEIFTKKMKNPGPTEKMGGEFQLCV